jgi:hypothetical protein
MNQNPNQDPLSLQYVQTVVGFGDRTGIDGLLVLLLNRFELVGAEYRDDTGKVFVEGIMYVIVLVRNGKPFVCGVAVILGPAKDG